MQQTNNIAKATNILFVLLISYYPIKYLLYIKPTKYYSLVLPI